MLIDDIAMSGEQSVYSVDIMQIGKRNASHISQALSTSRRAQVAGEEKKETARSLG